MNASDQESAAGWPPWPGKIKSGLRNDIAMFDGPPDAVFKNAGENQPAPIKHTC